MGVVFKKTPKGLEEIQHRQTGLNPRIRRLLILIDGQRSVDDLRSMVTMDDLTHALGLLEESGHIEVSGLQQADGAITVATPPLPPVQSFRELPAYVLPEDLEKARNFMINSLRSFSGHFEHVTLVHDIYNAAGHAELRLLYGTWQHAIINTREGKRRADELRAQLLAIL